MTQTPLQIDVITLLNRSTYWLRICTTRLYLGTTYLVLEAALEVLNVPTALAQ